MYSFSSKQILTSSSNDLKKSQSLPVTPSNICSVGDLPVVTVLPTDIPVVMYDTTGGIPKRDAHPVNSKPRTDTTMNLCMIHLFIPPHKDVDTKHPALNIDLHVGIHMMVCRSINKSIVWIYVYDFKVFFHFW